MRANALSAFAASVVLCASASYAQDFVAPASVESFSAVDGFGSHSIIAQSGPAENEAPLAAPCGGAVSRVAQAHFFYTSGAHVLSISVASPSPVTLLVSAPNGAWLCEAGDAPEMVFNPARSGRYAIWIGAVEQSGPATLTIQEREPPSPPAGP